MHFPDFRLYLRRSHNVVTQLSERNIYAFQGSFKILHYFSLMWFPDPHCALANTLMTFSPSLREPFLISPNYFLDKHLLQNFYIRYKILFMFYFNTHLYGQGYDVVSYWWEIQQIYKYFLCTSSENWFYKNISSVQFHWY